MEDHDRPRAASEDTRLLADSSTTNQLNPLNPESSARGIENSPSGDTLAGPKILSLDETVELARKAVEAARKDTQNALAGNEAVSEVVRPKLTIDLGHSNITRIPEPVVDLIKDDVERYDWIRSLTLTFSFQVIFLTNVQSNADLAGSRCHIIRSGMCHTDLRNAPNCDI